MTAMSALYSLYIQEYGVYVLCIRIEWSFLHTHTHTHTHSLTHSLTHAGLAPVHLATRESGIDVLKFLFQMGANKNAQVGFQNTHCRDFLV